MRTYVVVKFVCCHLVAAKSISWRTTLLRQPTQEKADGDRELTK